MTIQKPFFFSFAELYFGISCQIITRDDVKKIFVEIFNFTLDWKINIDFIHTRTYTYIDWKVTKYSSSQLYLKS